MNEFKRRNRIKKDVCYYLTPDAGKTTLTEKLLYFSGAIREAGTVKGKKQGNLQPVTG